MSKRAIQEYGKEPPPSRQHISELLNQTLIVIPAYNEEESLEATMNELLDILPTCHYLVVNDGSNDSTEQICQTNDYHHLKLPVNVGLAGAFQAGIKYAFEHGYLYVLQFDADGQHDPRYVETILEQAEHYDIVIGSRFLEQKKPLSLRMFGSSLITIAIRISTGENIKDPTSGMRLFGKRGIEAFATDVNCGPEPDTVSYLIKKRGASLKEIPVTMRERLAGTSYLNAKAAVRYMTRMAISILVVQPFRR